MSTINANGYERKYLVCVRTSSPLRILFRLHHSMDSPSHFLLWDLAFLSFKHYQQVCRRWLGLPSVIPLHFFFLPHTHLNSISVSPFNIPAHSGKSTFCHPLHSTVLVSSFGRFYSSKSFWLVAHVWFVFCCLDCLSSAIKPGFSLFCPPQV